MSLYRRGKIWHVKFTHNGKEIRRSTGTENKVLAQEFHDKLKHDLWQKTRLGVIPDYLWQDAVTRWCEERSDKKSFEGDLTKFRYLDRYLRGMKLRDINDEVIESIAKKKEKEGVRPATVNRYLQLIRAVLRKAARDWKMLEKVPYIRIRKEPAKRVRFLWKEEADRLIGFLPSHLVPVVEFALATGARASEILQLEWSRVDLQRQVAWLDHGETKNGSGRGIPLNEEAMNALRKVLGQHFTHCFTYKGKPMNEIGEAWKRALRKSGIEDFRFHDLRHTWASWHVMSGTSLNELMELGGWKSYEMVLKYAHLNPDHLKQVACGMRAVSKPSCSAKQWKWVEGLGTKLGTA